MEKNKESEAIWRVDALRRVLKEIHSLFVMFHGSVRGLLDKEPSGRLIRPFLHSFIMDYLSGKALIDKQFLLHWKFIFLYFGVQNILL